MAPYRIFSPKYETMDRADRAGASLVVFTLRTPGGPVESTRQIVTRMIASKTPIAVFIGPSGARAASAGFLITIAADVAAMAPGTYLGAAHPVEGNGQKIDDTMAKKIAEDLSAYARTLAQSVSPRSTAVIKAQIWKALCQDFNEALALADAEMHKSFASKDFKEGVGAFVEKRKPNFRGK